MRSTTTLRNVAAAYLVGIAWCVVMTISALALVDPMLSVSSSLEPLTAPVATIGTLGLAVLLATLVAGGLAIRLKRVPAERTEVIDRV
jgi:hypothetical protein